MMLADFYRLGRRFIASAFMCLCVEQKANVYALDKSITAQCLYSA